MSPPPEIRDASRRLRNRGPWWCRCSPRTGRPAKRSAPIRSPGFTALEKSRNSRMRFDAGDAVVAFLTWPSSGLGQALFLLGHRNPAGRRCSRPCRPWSSPGGRRFGPTSDDRDGVITPFSVIDAGMTQLFTDKSPRGMVLDRLDFDGDVRRRPGRLSFLSSSTVLAVGSRMSRRRLWVRCSN
jgi:hypothetical protein